MKRFQYMLCAVAALYMVLQLGRMWGQNESRNIIYASTPYMGYVEYTPLECLLVEIELEPEPEPGIITGDITYFCVCLKCCGKLDGITASGMVIKNGMENPYIASCNWLPFGTVIKIDGVEYTIMDRGGRSLDKVGRIDIFVPEGHEAALELGRDKNVDIEIVSRPEGE